MHYRPEIDGLRAIAVVPVLFFHAGFDFIGGGFAGVDVFFVVSGFLITSIIHREIREGRFSIVSFYERRARRLAPALFFVCVVSAIFAVMWMLPQELNDFGKSLYAINLFGSNFVFWNETGYFAPSSELMPLLHTWSLAVEEQFYIVLPLFLLALRRYPVETVLKVLVAGCVLSFGATQILARVDPAANFYLLPSRLWELGVGAMLALAGEDYSRLLQAFASLQPASAFSPLLQVIFWSANPHSIPAGRRCQWCLGPHRSSLLGGRIRLSAGCCAPGRWWRSASSATASISGTSRSWPSRVYARSTRFRPWATSSCLGYAWYLPI
ncbi:acyltransferase family protein [Ensifer aridi]|uniref:acyltransferase family protein n=1 Tax=Ensifer aridi TaxID=1708715 RepID=UPI000429A926|nr:acyltransferase [Ensifer aridi]